jgi:hypothetical protein
MPPEKPDTSPARSHLRIGWFWMQTKSFQGFNVGISVGWGKELAPVIATATVMLFWWSVSVYLEERVATRDREPRGRE